jgi:pSer/pThr/pTyr-binding forkhead associated (FHA) protein
MNTTITLTAQNGSMRGKQFVFHDPQACLLGRSRDCDLQLPENFEFRTISRHHCLLRVAPTSVCIRDLASRNGTYINGARIGRLMPGMIIGPTLEPPDAEISLKDGDQLTLADLVFAVHIETQQKSKAGRDENAREDLLACDQAELPCAFVGCTHYGL